MSVGKSDVFYFVSTLTHQTVCFQVIKIDKKTQLFFYINIIVLKRCPNIWNFWVPQVLRGRKYQNEQHSTSKTVFTRGYILNHTRPRRCYLQGDAWRARMGRPVEYLTQTYHQCWIGYHAWILWYLCQKAWYRKLRTSLWVRELK